MIRRYFNSIKVRLELEPFLNQMTLPRNFNSIKVRLEHHVATVKEDEDLISIP